MKIAKRRKIQEDARRGRWKGCRQLRPMRSIHFRCIGYERSRKPWLVVSSMHLAMGWLRDRPAKGWPVDDPIEELGEMK